jgi:hypothetical protein
MNRLGLGVLFVAIASACRSIPAQPAGAATMVTEPTLDGTWTNEEMGFPTKVVNMGEAVSYVGVHGWDGWKGSRRVVATWSDGEGNRWFKTFETVTENGCGAAAGHAFICPIVGTKWQLLQRISESGKTLEFVFVEVDQLDETKFPTTLEPDLSDLALAANHRIYHRP